MPTTPKRPSRPVRHRKTGETRRKPVPRAAEHIFEVLPDLIFRLDADGVFLEFMGGRIKDLYRKPEDFIGKPLGKVLPPEVAEFLIPRIRQVLKSGRPASVDYLLPMPDGPRRFEARLVPSGQGDILVLVRHHYPERQAETALREIEERYHVLVELSPSAIAVHDGKTILYINRAAADLLVGGVRERAVGRPLMEFVHPDSRKMVAARVRKMLLSRKPMPLAEERFLRADGNPVDVEVTASSFQEGGRTLIQVIFRDIAQRKAYEQAIVRLSRLNAVLGAANQAIARTTDRDELFRCLCRVAVEQGGMKAAWVGLVNAAERTVSPVASYGEMEGYPETTRISTRSGPKGRGPTGRAVREGRVVICNDIGADPAMAPWRKEALRRGFRSSAAVPIRLHDRVLGALNLYAPEPRAFGDQELEVLETLATDLEFALGALEQDRLRREAEMALAESEENFRGLFEHIKDGIYITAADGRILSCNAAALRMFGYTVQEMEGVNASQLYADPADRERFRAAVERDGAVRNFEVRLKRKDGALFDCILSSSLHRGPKGEVLGYQGIIHDITDRKRMEEALRSNEQRYRSIFIEGPLAMMVVGLDGRFIQVNTRFCRMLGYGEAELLGHTFAEFTHPDHVAADTAAVGRLVRGEIPLYKTEKRYIRKDGGIIWASLTVAAMRDGRGTPLFFQSLIEDITEQREAREALKAGEERFRDIIEHSTNLFYAHTPDHVLTYVSPQSRSILDCEPEEALVRWTEFATDHPVNQAGLEATQRAIDTGEPQPPYELQLKSRKGRIVWVEVREAPVMRDGRTVSIVGALTDITARKAAEEELRIKDYAMASALTGLVIMDLQMRLTYVNASVLRMWGYTEAAEVIGRRGVRFWADPGKARTAVRALQERGSYQGQLDARRRDGTVFPVEFSSNLVLDTTGRPLCLMGSFMDITERKAAEAALRESEEQMRALSENLAEGMVYQIDSGRDGRQRRFTYISPAVERLHGLSVEAVRREPRMIYEQVIEADRARLAEEEAKAYADRTTLNIDVQVSLPSGDVRWRRFISTPRALSDGSTAWDGIELDITERKREGVALRSSEEKFRALAEQSITGTCIVQDGRLAYVNPCLAEILGYSQEEMLGMPVLDLVAGPDRDLVAANMRKRLSGEVSSMRYMFIALNKAGAEVPMEVHGSAMIYLGRPAIMGALLDISDRKRAEQALRESLDMLQRSMQGTILAMMTMVEMRDPFTAGHQSRVARLACAIGRVLGLSEHQVEGLRVAGLLHDIGKIGVPAEILSKPGRILDFEYNIIKSHSEIGHKILKEIDFPWPIATMVLHHHERLDGSGYPEGLRAGAILLESRILVVADVVEAMASHRPYRPARGLDLALGEVEMNRGILYDPDVVDACLSLFREHDFTLD